MSANCATINLESRCSILELMRAAANSDIAVLLFCRNSLRVGETRKQMAQSAKYLKPHGQWVRQARARKPKLLELGCLQKMEV